MQHHPDPELLKAVNGAESDSQTAEGGGGGGGGGHSVTAGAPLKALPLKRNGPPPVQGDGGRACQM